MSEMFPVLVLALFVVIGIVILRFGPQRDQRSCGVWVCTPWFWARWRSR